MNVLLTGATGFIGNAVLRALLRQGHRVTACCRNPDRLLFSHPDLTAIRIDFASAGSMEQWLPHLGGIEAVVNCVGIIAEGKGQYFQNLHSGTPIALFKAGAQAGVKKIVQISALGADSDAVSAYHLSKKAADDALRSLPVDWFVLQPSIVYGVGAQSTALFHALAALPVHLVPDGGVQLLQPVHLDDVANAVCRCLDPHVSGQRTLALVGSKPISYAQLLQNLRHRLGKPPAVRLSVPYRYALMAAGFGKYLGEPILSRDNVAMLGRGNSADLGPLAELLGRSPLGIDSELFEKPASQAERWHAGLYFLKPLLRFAIALVWLWSGITSLFFYPHPLSYRLLADTGITGFSAPLALYGLGAMDIALGLATLARFKTARLMLFQFWIVLAYTVVVAFRLPDFVFHPFGPLLKNIPFLLSLLIYRQMEGEKP
ncbi:MAG: NAD(P)H-binding protein [Methylomonas sp.]